MVVDTSALLAILFDEPERAIMRERIAFAPRPALPATAYVEAALRVEHMGDPLFALGLDQLIAELALAVEPFTRDHAVEARLAFRRFGRGRHPADLNYGACMVYAVARLAGAPLLYKGGDFALTDIEPALPATT
jgi:ribonuclease VapC